MRRWLAVWLIRLSAYIDHHALLIVILQVRDDPAAQKSLSRLIVVDKPATTAFRLYGVEEDSPSPPPVV